MVWQATPAVRQRLAAMQRQLAAARGPAQIKRPALAERLGVSPITLRDWEHCTDNPSLPHLMEWAYVFGLRLVLVEPLTDRALVPWSLESGQLLVEYDMGRMASQLKRIRGERRVSQGDLALMVRVSRSSVQRWEDDGQVPGALHLIAWAGRLECRVLVMPERS